MLFAKQLMNCFARSLVDFPHLNPTSLVELLEKFSKTLGISLVYHLFESVMNVIIRYGQVRQSVFVVSIMFVVFELDNGEAVEECSILN